MEAGERIIHRRDAETRRSAQRRRKEIEIERETESVGQTGRPVLQVGFEEF
jgi:hypothetical protein